MLAIVGSKIFMSKDLSASETPIKSLGIVTTLPHPVKVLGYFSVAGGPTLAIHLLGHLAGHELCRQACVWTKRP